MNCNCERRVGSFRRLRATLLVVRHFEKFFTQKLKRAQDWCHRIVSTCRAGCVEWLQRLADARVGEKDGSPLHTMRGDD